ncbi:MAG: hypothetical protein ACRC2P_03630, partial [Eubacterium aggregans]
DTKPATRAFTLKGYYIRWWSKRKALGTSRGKEGRAAQVAGTIRQLANGSWEARYTLGRDPATGKQIQKSVYGKSQAEVRRKLAQITVEIDGGTYQDPSRLKVGKWLDIWQSYYLGGVKDSTKHEYAQVLHSHIVPPCVFPSYQKSSLTMSKSSITSFARN